jgi:hypothetical protein
LQRIIDGVEHARSAGMNNERRVSWRAETAHKLIVRLSFVTQSAHRA